MAGSGTNLDWDKIKSGVSETEKMIRNKEYNAAMIKARQTLEFMVKLQAERACIVDGGDLKAMIDTLYQNRWISKTTCERYHKIRMIGNKAAHEGDAIPNNANQAYHMLSQEVYTFANGYQNAKRGTKTPSRSSNGSSASRRPSSQSSASSRSRKRSGNARRGFTLYDLLKLLVPVLCIVLLLCVIKLVKPSDEKAEKPTEPQTTAAEAVTTAPEPETMPEEVPPLTYKTTSNLNVRSQPSTEGSPLATLDAGTTVTYIRAHDDTWAVIEYNGQEAYVASKYLTTE